MKFSLSQFNKKRFIMVAILGVVVFGFLFFPKPALALPDVADVVAHVLGWIILPIVTLLGKLITVVVGLLISVAQYNDFINATAVNIGWIIIRDICNMFFIVILLVIAFCTVLRIEQYSYKRLLGSLIIAAVVVNFSKLICGVIIDFAQVIMLTFVNAFKDAAEGNFATMIGLDHIMAARKDLGTVSGLETVIALILGLIMTVIALIVLVIMTIILFFRIVVLWFLVLLSPFAFVAGILPQTSRYSSMWWDKFTNQVIIGPVMAFFIWLSLAVVQKGWTEDKENMQLLTLPKEVREKYLAKQKEELHDLEGGSSGLTAAISKIGEGRYILNFVVGIAMLIGSLMAAQQLGVAGAAMAGRAINKMQNFAQGAARLTGRAIKAPMRAAVKGAAERFEAATGIPIRPSTIKREWETAMARRRWERQKKYEMRRAGLAEQIERKGWIGGLKGFAKDVLGIGKLKIKTGREKIEEAQKYAKEHISMSESIKKNQELNEKKKRLEDLQHPVLNAVNEPDKELLKNILEESIKQRIGLEEKIKEAQNIRDPIERNIVVTKLQKEIDKLEEQGAQVEDIMEAEGDVRLDIPQFDKLFEIYKQVSPDWKEVDSLTAAIQSLENTLKGRTAVDDKIWEEKYTKQIEEGKRLVRAGKEITEPMGSYSRRRAEAALMAEEMKRLPEVYDQAEFIALGRQFEKEKDWLKLKAVVTAMVQNGDINELPLADEQAIIKGLSPEEIDKRKKEGKDINTHTVEGWDNWAHHLAATFNKPLEDVRRAINEWQNMAMYSGQDRMAPAYVYDEELKDLRLKTPEEFKDWYLYQSGTGDVERKVRNTGKLADFGEEIGPDGKRRPVFGELEVVNAINKRGIWLKEINRRFNKDKLYYAGSPTHIEFMVTRVLPRIAPELSQKEIDEFIDLVRDLKRRWQELGRPDPGGRIEIPASSLAGSLTREQIKRIEEEIGISLKGLV